MSTNGNRRSRSPRRDYKRPPSRSPSGSRSRSYSQSPPYRSRSPRRPAHRRSRSGSRGRRNPVNRENPVPSKCIGVFGLNFRTRERELYDLFEPFGEIEDINLVMDNYTGRSRGFAFVYFRKMEDAKAAKEDCHGMTLDGRQIRVDYSITERPHTPTPGIYMGKSSAYPRRERSPYRGGGGGYRRSRSSRSPSYRRSDYR